MKCAKCNKEMRGVFVTVAMVIPSIIERYRLVCVNEKCEYYGIPRLDLRKHMWSKNEKENFMRE